MAVIQAKNCNRSYAIKNQSMGANFESLVIDFHDMPMGSIHFLWSGLVGTLDCEFKIFASNLPEVSSFDEIGTLIDCSSFVPHATSGSKIWIRDRIGFRYALVRFYKNNLTSGSVDIIALGKKS
jgi:hypothetical protein